LWCDIVSGRDGLDVQVQAAGGQVTDPSRVLARTQITSPVSSTSSKTSADNPENTIPASSIASMMTERDTSAH
jgi:hypothetical protein